MPRTWPAAAAVDERVDDADAGAGTPRASTATSGAARTTPPRRRHVIPGRVTGTDVCSDLARSDLARQQGALDLLDRLGHLDAARARLAAVEGRAAAPHALLVVEDLQAQVRALVPAVEDEPVRVDDRGRPEVLPVGPEHGAR